jgi:O-antigen/teichoic acid export membrane protein
VIYGAGRAMQKFLTALMLPLFTAFMTKSDYGVLGMVVTVTTFLDVFVTLLRRRLHTVLLRRQGPAAP